MITYTLLCPSYFCEIWALCVSHIIYPTDKVIYDFQNLCFRFFHCISIKIKSINLGSYCPYDIPTAVIDSGKNKWTYFEKMFLKEQIEFHIYIQLQQHGIVWEPYQLRNISALTATQHKKFWLFYIVAMFSSPKWNRNRILPEAESISCLTSYQTT